MGILVFIFLTSAKARMKTQLAASAPPGSWPRISEHSRESRLGRALIGTEVFALHTPASWTGFRSPVSRASQRLFGDRNSWSNNSEWLCDPRPGQLPPDLPSFAVPWSIDHETSVAR